MSVTLLCGGEAYAVSGGMQIESAEVFSDTNWQYSSVHPVVAANMRDDKDKHTIWMNTVFGKTVDKDRNILPVTDDRTSPSYTTYEGFAVQMEEVSSDTVSGLFSAAMELATIRKKIELLMESMQIPDVTADGIKTVTDELSNQQDALDAVATFTSSDTNLSYTGRPVLETFRYTYDSRLDRGALSLKFIS